MLRHTSSSDLCASAHSTYLQDLSSLPLHQLTLPGIYQPVELVGKPAPVMALIVPPANEKKRVKVYELKNNDWFDRGTGFCTGRIINVSDYGKLDAPFMSFLFPDVLCNHQNNRTLTCIQDESKIYVESEDSPERLLLETRITKDDGYQKQQGERAWRQ